MFMEDLETTLYEKIKKFKPIIKKASLRELNESDTSTIVNDFIGESLGYDKYNDITTEYKIKSNFCDYGIKIKGKLKFLIEVKKIGLKLNKKHIEQILTYSANEGCSWIVLTNLKEWEIYKVTNKKKLEEKLIFRFNFLTDCDSDIYMKMKYLHIDNIQAKELEKVYKNIKNLKRKYLQDIILSNAVINHLQKKLEENNKVILSKEVIINELKENIFI